jgi:hypothetical protein
VAEDGVPLFKSARALVQSGVVDWTSKVHVIPGGEHGNEVFVNGTRVAIFRLDPAVGETEATKAVADARARCGV